MLMDQLRYSSVRDIFSARVDSRAGCSNGLTELTELTESPAKEIYFGLLEPRPAESAVAQSRRFLAEQLQSVACDPVDMPADADDLMLWMRSNTAAVAKQYRHYLDHRKKG